MNKLAIDTQPWGFCQVCLQSILDGTKPVQVFTLADGSQLVEAHCAERSVGALLHLRPGKPQCWKLTVPIDAIEWREQVVPTHIGARNAFIEAASAPSLEQRH